MRCLAGAVQALDEARRAACADVLREDAVRIVEIADDEVEAAEVIAQAGFQNGPAGKEPRQSSVFDRAGLIGQTT